MGGPATNEDRIPFLNLEEKVQVQGKGNDMVELGSLYLNPDVAPQSDNLTKILGHPSPLSDVL